MDVSSESAAQGIGCDVCGYSRRGLAADARCPECGEGPPKLVGSGAAARTQEEQTWLRSVAVGLWILIAASLGALQVALVIPAAELSLGTVNFPGPKVHAAAMLQRSIGGQPGPWGVSGTFWAMGTVLGVWLLTEPRAIRGDFERGSLRKATRWTAVLSAGGVLGLLLSWAELYIPTHSGISLNLSVAAVALCELPANVLLYFYLRQIAEQMGDRRSAAVLNHCVWGVPLVIGGAIFLLATGGAAHRAWPMGWRLVGMAFGGTALALGVAATAAVGRLAVIATAGAVTGTWRGKLMAIPELVRIACRRVDAHRWRASVVLGLALLIWAVPYNIHAVVGTPSRKGLAGDVPLLNFAGPKVMGSRSTAALTSHYDYFWQGIGELLTPVLVNLLGIWLVTRPRGTPAAGGTWDSPERWRWATRWAATLAVAGPIGFVLGRAGPVGISPSVTTAWVSLLCEAPTTCLLYLHLARLAPAPIGRRLRPFALIAPLLILTPMMALVLSASMRAWHGSLVVGGLCALFMAESVAATIVASFALVGLAWAVARPMWSADAGEAL